VSFTIEVNVVDHATYTNSNNSAIALQPMPESISPIVLEIERSIHTLSFNEKLWLMERIAQQLRSKTRASEPSILESQLADMANDPEMQAELNAIRAEFLVTEMDGLKLP
jgi:hypothetical protein